MLWVAVLCTQVVSTTVVVSCGSSYYGWQSMGGSLVYYVFISCVRLWVVVCGSTCWGLLVFLYSASKKRNKNQFETKNWPFRIIPMQNWGWIPHGLSPCYPLLRPKRPWGVQRAPDDASVAQKWSKMPRRDQFETKNRPFWMTPMQKWGWTPHGLSPCYPLLRPKRPWGVQRALDIASVAQKWSKSASKIHWEPKICLSRIVPMQNWG